MSTNSVEEAEEAARPLFEDEEGLFAGGEDDDEDEEGSVKVAREDIQLMNVVRAIVILFLLTVATIFAESVFIATLIGEQNSFEDAFSKTSATLLAAYYARLNNDLWVANALATSLHLAATESGGVWPNITFGDFDGRCQAPLRLSDASSIAFSPLLENDTRDGWEAYAADNYRFGIHRDPQDGVRYFPSGRSANQGIYKFDLEVSQDKPDSADILAPIWQLSPFQGNDESGLVGTMFDEHSNNIRALAIAAMTQAVGPCMTNFQYQDSNNNDYVSYEKSPRSTVYYPILNHKGNKPVAGSLAFEYAWESLLTKLVDEDDLPIVVVAENRCGGKFSFNVHGHKTTFIGEGDLHDDDVDGYNNVTSSDEEFEAVFQSLRRYPSTYKCSYRLNLYATSEYKAEYVTNSPELYRGAVLGIFLFVVGIFVCYDCLVERRQNRVVKAAQRSDAIVRSLFPSKIRDRLYEQAKEKEEKAKAERQGQTHSVWKTHAGDEGAVFQTAKHRLKAFINNAPGEEHQQVDPQGVGGVPSQGKHQDPSGMEPIADLFPETTILFADIAGFTAWSSEREPAQVFTLLETIYRHMDQAAKKLGVFKVETVGDCYVAATGIPDPIPNHAEVMVRFARSCLLKVDLLTKELEAQLGPGTAELCMRFGIHSGPVTAGVLRGQKARFQLFGDTMNTASRMESTGMKNKVQISGDTANLLIKAGLGHWIQKRQDLVHVKGKGDMQTYWVLLGTASLSLSSGRSGVSDTANLESLITPKNRVHKKKKLNIYAGLGLDGVLGVTEIDESLQRLVDWNVDVLLSLLKRVIASRIASGQATKALSAAAEREIIGNGLVLDDIQMVIEFPQFDAEIARRAVEEEVELIPEVKKQLIEFVTAIASGYKRVAFHNFEHASHVILSANKLLKRVMTADEIATNEKDALASKELYDFTYGIGTDPVIHFAVVFSALIHDVGHPGVPNFILAQEDPGLARKYVNKSLAEQHSVDIAWELLLDSRFNSLRACIYQNKRECKHFRNLVVNSVMATDIFDKELKALRDSRWDMAFHSEPKPESAITKEDVDRKATIVIEHIIQASDVSHTMQHWYIYLKWNERLFREMYFAYLVGRNQKDPSAGWFESELWFFDNYVIPLARKLKECCVFGISSDEYLTYALQNRVEWEKKGKAMCEKFFKNAEAEAKDMELHKFQEKVEEGGEEEATVDVSGSNSDKYASLTPAPEENTVENLAGTPGSKIIVVPPGKLGIFIDTTDEGPTVYKVNPDSSLRGKLQEGDIIIAIDGVLTEGMDNAALTELIASGQSKTRRFTVSNKLQTITEIY